jgi:predicted Zn-dependent protease
MLRAHLLYEAGRWADARRLGDSLVTASPSDPERWWLVGASAARLGDTVAARRALARLDALPTRYSLGIPSFAAARVLAALGQRDAAVAALRRSIAQGHEIDLALHRDLDLSELRGYAPFDALLAPRRDQ